MKYKVGDRVKIKSLDWYNRHTNGTEVDCGAYPFTSNMKKFCGQERIIANVCHECYLLLGIYDGFVWTDEMIEGLVEEDVSYDAESEWLKHEISLPDGYIFKDENGNVINATKIVLEKRKKEYPKTYEECEKVLRYDSHRLDDMGVTVRGYKWELIRAFQILLICRDAYWKIAGEEIGLGKPWEPDWTNQELLKYCIASVEGQVKTAERYIINTILAFPTAEMRDAFKENFDPDIEFCKEFL